MKLLALDTATEACSAAVLADGKLVTRYLELARGHSEQILPMIHAVLEESGVSLRALDAIAFGRGPGAFTGVRLAASITQGLAFGAGLRVVPVSNLRALAQRALDADAELASVLVCSDARMHEVYWCAYRRDRSGLAEQAAPERVSAPAEVAVPEELARPRGGAGRGFTAYPQLEERLGSGLVRVSRELLPRAQEIAQLAKLEFAAGRSLAPEQALPEYLRNDVARPASPPSRN